MLGIFISMSSIAFSESLHKDSSLIDRIYSYSTHHDISASRKTSTIYTKWRYNTVKRNVTLWLIPHMYGIAKGKRSFITESYGTMVPREDGSFQFKRQATVGTIPHNSKTMTAIQKFLTPDYYGATIYNGQILSPFHRSNKKFYKYSITAAENEQAVVNFKPKVNNHTQLVSGQAFIDRQSGRIIRISVSGEFDMLKFHTESVMDDTDTIVSGLPRYCKTNFDFKFIGNHITSSFEAFYNTKDTVSEPLNTAYTIETFDSLRPTPLTMQDTYIYEMNGSFSDKRDSTQTPQEHKRKNNLKELVWNIGDNLVNSLTTESEKGYLKLSPIINPQYISYSHSKGLAYKMKLKAKFNFNKSHYIDFNPRLGYNSKQRRFYFSAPLHFIYYPKRNGRIIMEYSNGNLISPMMQNTIDNDLHTEAAESNTRRLLFSDNRFHFSHNITVIKGVDLETGFNVRRRRAQHIQEVGQAGLSSSYTSFSPVAALQITPWKKGPVLSIDYERGIKGVYKSHQEFERWEFDASMKYCFSRMRTLSLRAGYGFYSFGKHGYFLDYANFRDNNLPEAWNDEWTGNFQLLSSRLYNSSTYYARSNITFEAPLLLTAYLPLVGRYIERERLYLSSVLLDDKHIYNEAGYGFSCRWFSIGCFASFRQAKFQKAECKLTFELFKRW